MTIFLLGLTAWLAVGYLTVQTAIAHHPRAFKTFDTTYSYYRPHETERCTGIHIEAAVFGILGGPITCAALGIAYGLHRSFRTYTETQALLRQQEADLKAAHQEIDRLLQTPSTPTRHAAAILRDRLTGSG